MQAASQVEQFPGQATSDVNRLREGVQSHFGAAVATILCSAAAYDRRQCIGKAAGLTRNADQLVKPTEKPGAFRRGNKARSGQPIGQVTLPKVMGEWLED